MIQIHDIWEGDGQKWGFIGRLRNIPPVNHFGLNLAEPTGTDVAGGVQKLAIALQDPISGIGSLNQHGISFTEVEK